MSPASRLGSRPSPGARARRSTSTRSPAWTSGWASSTLSATTCGGRCIGVLQQAPNEPLRVRRNGCATEVRRARASPASEGPMRRTPSRLKDTAAPQRMARNCACGQRGSALSASARERLNRSRGSGVHRGAKESHRQQQSLRRASRLHRDVLFRARRARAPGGEMCNAALWRIDGKPGLPRFRRSEPHVRPQLNGRGRSGLLCVSWWRVPRAQRP